MSKPAAVVRKRRDDSLHGPTFTEREIKLEHGKSTLEFKSLADKVARHSFFNVNYHCECLKAEFPINFNLWYVTRMYPYAVDAKGEINPLYVDMPTHP